jgi:asparagine synthase (glutamine-hydrolysing)
MGAVRQQWRAILDGQLPFDFRVWRWLNLICWAQRFEVRFH